MKQKAICCYILFVLVAGALNSGNSMPSTVNKTTTPFGTVVGLATGNSAVTGVSSLWHVSFGGNAGN